MLTLQLISLMFAFLAALSFHKLLAIIALTVHVTALISEWIMTNNKGSLEMALILTDEQEVTLSLNPKTRKGNPASLDGAPEWSNSNEAVVGLEVSVDGLTAVVKAKGLGAAQVSVVADADLDADEVRELTDVLDVVVVAAEAASLGITAGVPTDQE